MFALRLVAQRALPKARRFGCYEMPRTKSVAAVLMRARSGRPGRVRLFKCKMEPEGGGEEEGGVDRANSNESRACSRREIVYSSSWPSRANGMAGTNERRARGEQRHEALTIAQHRKRIPRAEVTGSRLPSPSRSAVTVRSFGIKAATRSNDQTLSLRQLHHLCNFVSLLAFNFSLGNQTKLSFHQPS